MSFEKQKSPNGPADALKERLQLLENQKETGALTVEALTAELEYVITMAIRMMETNEKALDGLKF